MKIKNCKKRGEWAELVFAMRAIERALSPQPSLFEGGIPRLRTARDFTTISSRDTQTGSVPRRLKPRFFLGLGCGASGTRALPGQTQGQGQRQRAGVPLHAIRNPHFSQRTREMGNPAISLIEGLWVN